MIWPWIHILIAYAVYILFALASSVVIAKIAGNLREMSTRNSPRVTLLGFVANLIIMILIGLLLVFMDGKSIVSLGLQFHGADALASFGGSLVIFLVALGFIGVMRRTRLIESVSFVRPATSNREVLLIALGLGMLVAVAMQEEVLNRGYVTLNLRSYSLLAIILISTTLFTLIHFLTNRGGAYQVFSWVVGGLVLIVSYLMSGSLWVPIILHFATDSANLLLFNITGQYSVVVTSPPISVGQRAAFRLVYGVAMAAILLAAYGTHLALP